MTLFITFALGLFFIIGVFIIKAAKNSETVEHISIAVAFGAMVTLAIGDLIPEIIADTTGEKAYIPVIFIIAGIGLLKVLDIFIPDHDSTEDIEKEMIHIGLISAFAIILHNVIEGMAVYGIALQSMREGLNLALGVGMHNIPMGMLIYSTLQKEDRLKKYIVLAFAAGSTFLGGVCMALMEGYMNGFMIGVLICITLGMLIYILFFELLPYMVRSKKPVISVIGTLAGIAVVVISMMLE